MTEQAGPRTTPRPSRKELEAMTPSERSAYVDDALAQQFRKLQADLAEALALLWAVVDAIEHDLPNATALARYEARAFLAAHGAGEEQAEPYPSLTEQESDDLDE